MKILSKFAAVMMIAVFVAASVMTGAVYADGEENNDNSAMSVSISPVSKVLDLEADKVYEDVFKVTNNGKEGMNFEVYASPYSYTFSEEDNEYRLGFSKENNYTQITRWITFKDASGNYVPTTKFYAEPEKTVEVTYRISTPSSIPAGGQYAVLFAHTLSNEAEGSGIRTEASPGLVVYGRSVGETNVAGTVKDSKISQTLMRDNNQYNIINGSAKVSNDGNVDFMAQGTLKVEGIFGRVYYETLPSQGRVSVIPESELTVSDAWDDTPYFGIFKATWTVMAAGHTEEPITKMILILPVPIIILMILLLTIVIVWIIILIRKRKERRSRFMV